MDEQKYFEQVEILDAADGRHLFTTTGMFAKARSSRSGLGSWWGTIGCEDSLTGVSEVTVRIGEAEGRAIVGNIQIASGGEGLARHQATLRGSGPPPF